MQKPNQASFNRYFGLVLFECLILVVWGGLVVWGFFCVIV